MTQFPSCKHLFLWIEFLVMCNSRLLNCSWGIQAVISKDTNYLNYVELGCDAAAIKSVTMCNIVISV